MYKTGLALILLLSVSFGLYAQSGRKMEPKPKTEPTKTDDDGLTESKINPAGETVEGDVIRFDTALVMVPVSVLDRNGRYVPQLRKDQFRLAENGVDQKIAYFATTDSPFSVVLLIDTSGSTQMRLDDIQDAAIKFVGKLKPTDSVMVMSFDDRIQVQCKATTDRDVIEKAIRRTRTGGGTRLYDAVDDILRKQLKTIAGRKAVVLFTDGVDTTSHRASYDSTIRLAEESDAPIYSVDYDTSGMGSGGMGRGTGGRGTIFGIPIPTPGIPGSTIPGSSPGDYRRAVAYLHALSNQTGGRFYSGDSQFGIAQAFTWIAEELGRQYSLGYYPSTPGKDGERRQIKVRTTESDLVIKARDSYIYTDKSKKFTQMTRLVN
ncbi:MAG TPA: VWA domain-containing protein [Pyrinomonadaceae bacterium]|jgi:Ca-activated chloride channel homolog|nr:VWA domain-containing protein [Pyrinomonadaceae bacterium]